MKIFIPIEIKKRELDSKLLIGREMSKKGLEVFIGRKEKINELALRNYNSIYFAKSAATSDLPLFIKLKQMNHKIAVLDEEAIVHINPTTHLKERFNKETLKLLDLYCAWGEYDSTLVKKYFPNQKNKIVITGNPRIDLLRKDMRGFHQKRIGEIYKKYGDFILIPSNFAMCNHFEKGGLVKLLKDLEVIKNIKEINLYKNYSEHFQQIFNIFFSDIIKLAEKLPTITFIVRPHPSENKTTFLEMFNQIPNIKVLSHGPITDWLGASKLIIHNGCTTAVEGTVMGKKVLSYRPIINQKYELNFPNQISDEVFNYETLLDKVKENINAVNEFKLETNNVLTLRKYLSSLNDEFSFKKISRYVFDLIKKDDYKNINKIKIYFLIFSRTIMIQLRSLKKFFIGARINDYKMQKFDYLKRREIKKILQKYNQLFSEEILFKIKKYSDDVFLLKI